MLDLVIQLLGKRFIAKEMALHLPLKTLKQIRDKRKEATYKRKRDELLTLAQRENLIDLQLQNAPLSL
jgi:hypothetical protein